MYSHSQGLDLHSNPCATMFLLMIRSRLSSAEALWSSRDVGQPTLAYVLLPLNEWPCVFFLCSSLVVGAALYWDCLHQCPPPPSCMHAIDNVIWVNWLEIECNVNAESFHIPFKYTSAQQCLVHCCSSELFLNQFLTSCMWETGWKSLAFCKQEVRLASLTDPFDL